jgi:hypothetical protein
MTDAARQRETKRYNHAVRKRGTCGVCKHRQPELDRWGKGQCTTHGRQHPTCQMDHQQPTFRFDETVMGEFRDAT